MTGNAGHVHSVGRHVDIDVFVAGEEAFLQVTVLDIVAAATIKMTYTAVALSGRSYAQGNIGKVD